jgi:hypothetical protein
MTIFLRLTLLAAILAPGAGRADDLSTLIRWLPDDINAVAVVRAADLLKSTRGQAEGWARRADAAFLAGAMSLPSDVTLYVRGAHLQPAGAGRNSSVALLDFSRNVDMERLASREKSTVETVLGKPAVRSPRNCYFALIDPQVLGVVSPAYRQELAWWLKRIGQEDEPLVSGYLTDVLNQSKGSIVMAIDLADMFEPDRIRQYLAASPALGSDAGALRRVTELFLTLQGLQLEVTVTDRTQALLTIQFAREVGEDSARVKSILLEALADRGAAVDAFEAGEASALGTSVQISAPLGDEDLRRIMSLITSPHPSTSTTEDITQEVAEANPRISPEATSRYFLAVDQVLQDLQKANRRAKDYARTATWHDNFAAKIEQMPTVAVDPDVVAYGESVSKRLRALAASLRGVAIDINQLQNAVTYSYSVDPGWEHVDWWGGYGYRAPSYNYTSNLAEVREKQAQSIAAGAKDREQVWAMLSDDRTKTLDAMRTRYGADFAANAK